MNERATTMSVLSLACHTRVRNTLLLSLSFFFSLSLFLYHAVAEELLLDERGAKGLALVQILARPLEGRLRRRHRHVRDQQSLLRQLEQQHRQNFNKQQQLSSLVLVFFACLLHQHGKAAVQLAQNVLLRNAHVIEEELARVLRLRTRKEEEEEAASCSVTLQNKRKRVRKGRLLRRVVVT